MADGFTLEKFSENAFYQEVNERLVALARPQPGQCVVDLGAGTGAVTRLLVAEVASEPTAEVIAVEPSESFDVLVKNLDDQMGRRVV